MLNGANGFRIDGGSTGQITGSVSMAGDFNGDGLDDFMVATAGVEHRGSTYVIFGHAGGFPAALDLSTLDGTNGFRLDGERNDFADRVSAAGDVNGDGFDDVVIGARGKFKFGRPGYGYMDHVARAGRCYVVFGHASGFAPVVNLGSLNGNDGYRIVDGQFYDLGQAVGSAGDINGDGFDDIVVSGTYKSTVLFGKAGGFAPVRKMSQLTSADGFYLGYGYSVGTKSAGDVNGDGFDDLIVGSPKDLFTGSAYVVYGKATGFGGSINLPFLDGTNGFQIAGAVDGEYAGSAVSGGGDLNGDGFADVIVGAPGGNLDQPDAKAYVVFGGNALPAVVDVSTLTGANGFQLTGAHVTDYQTDKTGRSVTGLGDFNGDGFDDLLIGADGGVGSGPHSGAVVFGKASGFPPSLAASGLDGANGFQLIPAGASGYGDSVSGGGDINGDGLSDLVMTVKHRAYVVFGGTANGLITHRHTARFLDADGDVVTVKVDRGSLTLDNFDLVMDGPLGGAHFAGLDLTHGDFAGANVTITAQPSPQGGDGHVDLGFLNAAGIDLGKVTIDGDLGRIDAGDDDPSTPALLALHVHSMGAQGPETGGPFVLESHLIGGLGRLDAGTIVGGLRVSDSIHDSAIHIGGDLARLVVGGDLADSTLTVRGDYFTPDRLTAQTVGFIQVGGSVDHSQLLIGYNAAGKAVNGEVQIGTVTVGGDWIASNLVVGGVTGQDQSFGTADDARIGDVNIFGAFIALDDLNGTNGTRFTGVEGLDFTGTTVSSAGDINGDGFDDIIIGSPSAAPNDTYSHGSVRVVFGKAGGFGANFDLGSLDGTNGFRLDGESQFDYAGRAVSAAGDINGDGYDDLLIGATGTEFNGVAVAGSVYVVFGKPTPFPAVVELGDLTGPDGFRMDGLESYTAFGAVLHGAGDLNHDGYDDLVLGAGGSTVQRPAMAPGSAYVIFGRARLRPHARSRCARRHHGLPPRRLTRRWVRRSLRQRSGRHQWRWLRRSARRGVRDRHLSLRDWLHLRRLRQDRWLRARFRSRPGRWHQRLPPRWRARRRWRGLHREQGRRHQP